MGVDFHADSPYICTVQLMKPICCMNPRTQNRNLSRAVGLAPANGNLHFLAVQGFVGWTPAKVPFIKPLIMSNPHLKTSISQLPQDVQQYIKFLEERNRAFIGMLDPDLYDYVVLLDLLGSSMLTYMNSLKFKEDRETYERGEVLCAFYDGLSKAIQHLKATTED